MKNITVRKNKNYTTILLNSCNKETFLQSIKIRDELETPAIIKPSKKAFDDYMKTEKPQEKMLSCKNVGDKFTIMGIEFTKIETSDGLNGKNPITLQYTDYRNKKSEFGTFCGYANLLEDVFQTLTKGNLLYF